MRYARVQAVLEGEAAFVAKMGSATEAVFKPTGEKQLFAPEVIAVTQAIHNAGKDAHKVHKTEIIRFAVQVFKIGQPAVIPPVNGATVIVPEPTPPPTAEVNAAPAAAPKPAKAAAKPPVKQKLKPAVVSAPAPAPEPPKKEEPPKHSTPVESETREAALNQARETLNPERPGENAAAFNAYISMYSMTLTLLQLVELYDNQPGKDKRYKTLDDLAKEFNKFTSIKSAKEAQKA
jgi:outer membrane biosynthesis protein TonB